MDSVKLAQQLQSQGRGYDDVLVHMNRQELAGLEALARQNGTALTRNPKTGLPEAGILESLLPALAGAATMYFTGSPWGAAAVGALTGAATNRQNPWMGAGLGALGGWGGAGLGAGLAGSGVGAAAAEEAATQEALSQAVNATASSPTMMAQASQEALAQRIADLNAAGASPDMISGMASPSIGYPAGDPIGELVNKTDALAASQQRMADIASRTGNGMELGIDTIKPQWTDVARGAGEWVKNPGQALQDNWKYGAAAFAPMVLGMDGGGTNVPSANSQSPTTHRQVRYDPNSHTFYYGAGEGPSSSYRDIYTGMAAGGIAGLGYAGGGHPRMIKGPGTGLSDSVPAHINGSQPAALADGEFVVSADVVSALGGGSTDAGARKLYDMMDRIRSQAHGSKKQVRKVNDKKVLPA